MNKELRKTLVLLSLLVGLLGVFFIFQVFEVKTPEERKDSARWVLPSANDKFKPVKSGDITGVVVERGKNDAAKAQRIEFQKQNNDWRMVAPKTTRADFSNVNRLIDQVMTAEREKYADLSKNNAEYGLQSPKTVVTLYRGDQAFTVSFGDEGPGKEPVVYVNSSEINEPMAVSKSRLDRVFAELEDFRSKDLFSSSFDINRVEVVAGKSKLELEQADGKDWRFKEPKLGDADNNAADELIRNLGNIRVERNSDFVADGKDLDLAKYGLTDDKTPYVVTLQRKSVAGGNPIVETLLIGAKDTEARPSTKAARAAGGVALLLPIPGTCVPGLEVLSSFAALKAGEKVEEDTASYFAKLKTENSVVRIDGKHLKAIEKKPDELRSKALVRIDATRADAINLTTAGETMRFRRSELKLPPTPTAAAPGLAAANWELFADKRNKAKTHLNVVPDLIDALNKVSLKDAAAFLDDGDKQRAWFGMDTIDLGLDKPQAEVAVWLEGIQRDKEGKPEGDGEPKTKDAVKDKPDLKLAFGRKDDKRGVVYVRRKVGDNPENILAVPDPWVSVAAEPPPPQFPGAPQPPPRRDTISLTEKVTPGYYAFRDHVLPSFTTANAKALTLTRQNDAYALEKEEKKDDKGALTVNWLLKKPVEGKASPAAEMLLFLLSGLTTDKVVTDKATEQELKDFGLGDKPFLRATITAGEKDKKPSEYVYTIGRTTDPKGPNANHFYTRLEVKPGEGAAPDANQWVFLLPWTSVQSLDAELRDTTVFPEEKSAKPELVTLTWRKLDREKKLQETKLVLAFQPEKEGSATKVWTVQSLTVNGKDAKAELPKLDVAKVEQLLGTTPQARFGLARLNPLDTRRFVVHNGKPEPRHRLDPASKDTPPFLVIDIQYDSKLTRSLTIGDLWEPKDSEYPGLAPRTYYFAAASTLPNAVFVLDEIAVKDLTAGVDYFKVQEKVSLAR